MSNTPIHPRVSSYEVVWRLKHDHLVGGVHSLNSLTDKLAWVLENDGKKDLADGNEMCLQSGC